MLCNGCGAELQLGPNSCPLCGAESRLTGARKPKRRERPTVDDYQASVRELREQLQALRDGAKAV
jgi:predicted amidophosphoribosyltransferase